MDHDLPAVPQEGADAILALLREARAEAVDHILKAELAEKDARAARRAATARQKHYEHLLLEHGGQLRLPYDERITR